MDLNKSITSSIKWTTTSALITSLARLAQVAILTRFLAKEDFGLIAIALLFISFTDIFLDLGISSAVIHKQDISRSQYSSLFWLNIITGLLIYSILYAVTPMISSYYNKYELNSILPILSVNILFSSVSRLQRTYQQKNLNFALISQIDILGAVIMLASSIVLAYFNYGVYSLVYSTLASSLSIAIVYIIRMSLIDRFVNFTFSIKSIFPFLKIGSYQIAGSILDFFSSEMDIILISTSFDAKTLGVYSLCKQLAMRIYSFINPIITKVLAPSLSLMQHDIIQVRNKYMKTLEVLAFINFPIYIFAALFSSVILTIIYGPQYSIYSMILSILCLNFAVQSIGNPVGALQVALGRTDIGFYWTIYRICSYGLFLLIGIHFNIYYCTLSILLVNILNIHPSVKIMMKKLIHIKTKDYLKVQAKPILFSFALFPLLFIAKLTNNPFIIISIALPLFSFSYLILSKRYNKSIMEQVIAFLPNKFARLIQKSNA